MKWSVFSYKIDLDDKKILLNTINNALVEIKNEEYTKIEKYIHSKICEDEKIKEYIDQLSSMEFLIEDYVDEKRLYMNGLINDWENDDFFSIHILPTTNCNFSCAYCYQSGISRKNYLTDEDCDKIIKYINNYLKLRPQIQRSNIIIHGGEPTLNWKFVENFLPCISALYNSLGITFNTQIVTNGYMLTSEKSDFLSKFNWNRAQLTLDGLKEIHDSRRCLKNGTGSFDKIVENMHYIINNDRLPYIDLRINYDKNNICEIPNLINYISEEFKTSQIRLSFGLVTSTIDNTSAYKYVEKNSVNESTLPNDYFSLYKIASEKGFLMREFFVFDGMCTSKMKNSMVISSDGNIFKCLSMVGRDEFSIGTILENTTNMEDYFFKDLYEECFEKKCALIPICHTGCRFDAYLKNKNIHTIDCRYEQTKKINTKLFQFLYD